MNYCKKCQKPIHSKKDSYRGLCLNCHLDYLYEKIDRFQEEGYTFDTTSESFFTKVKNFIKKIFDKK